jgi:ankyrin repeat protein
LREINEANWEFACRLFQCVSVASRPLRVEELAEFLAFDFKAGRIPEFHEDRCLEDPANQLLSTCSSLLSIVNVEGFPVIQFSHASVKEFLTSTRLAETSDKIIRRYHISMTPAHTLAAKACLGILLHLDENITINSLQKFPLAKYAAKHLVDHARFENVYVSPSIEDGMKQLFDPNKPHLAVWVWIYDPEEPWHRGQRGERPSPPSGTPLHYAAHYGLDGIVKYLVIEHAQDVNARGLYKKSTPLHRASARGHVTVVRVLLEHDADVTAQNEDGSTPLHLASRWGGVKVVHILLKHGADATAQDINRSTPLHQASSAGHVDSARVLLELGVDATAQDKNGWTPLHWASYEGHVGVTRVLLKHGVDATVQDKDGRTPLYRASFEGHLEIIHVLLEHGVDATAQNEDGRTILHRASFAGRVKVVRILLEHFMDSTVQDMNGRTPLHHASREGHLEVVRILLEHGARATPQDKNGRTPLHHASRKGHLGVVRILLEHGAYATPRDKDGRTPLHHASQKGHLGVVRILLEHGAYATPQDKDGRTPLHHASQMGHLEVVRVLLELGTNATAPDRNGWTPSILAFQNGYTEAAYILLEHGNTAFFFVTDPTVHAEDTTHSPSTPIPTSTSTQERQARPARGQVLRVDAQLEDGPWTVGVAEDPHRPSSYTLYVKSKCTVY